MMQAHSLPCSNRLHAAHTPLPRTHRHTPSHAHAQAHISTTHKQVTAAPHNNTLNTPSSPTTRTVRSSRRAATASAASSAPVQQTLRELSSPDLVLHVEGSDKRIHVFGVEHTAPQPHIAEYIYKMRPAAVIVETALTPEHGSRPGNTISCRDRVIEGPQAFFMRVFCGVAAQLQELEQQGEDVMSSSMWQQVAQGQFRGEQLAYIAALASDTKIVFGDRPKDITYRRLYGMSSLAQLDEGYGHQVISNTRYILEVLKGSSTTGGAQNSSGSSEDNGVSSNKEGSSLVANEVLPSEATHWVDRVMMKEREALMCKVACDAASGQLPALILEPPEGLSTESEPSDTEAVTPKARSQDVVMVVGSAHLEGLQALWKDGLWKELLGGDGVSLLSSPLLTSPPLTSVPENQAGMKRGMVHCLMRQSCTDEVLANLEDTLGPLPPQQQLAYDAISEVYSSDRAMLACLPRELLQEVWQGSPAGHTGEHVMDAWAALQPFRDNRFVNGGPGCTEELIILVRGLNFELD